jgi:hypothetical protein
MMVTETPAEQGMPVGTVYANITPMDLVVDPKQRCVTPNPAHSDGPLFRA